MEWLSLGCVRSRVQFPDYPFFLLIFQKSDFWLNFKIYTYESIHFKDINFNGESAEESKNLIKIENINKIGTLDDTEVELPIQKNLFRIKGKLNPINLLEENTIIPISFLVEKKIQKIYQCKAIQISPQCILQCNTSNNPINTTVKEMHLGVSKNYKISLIIYNNLR